MAFLPHFTQKNKNALRPNMGRKTLFRDTTQIDSQESSSLRLNAANARFYLPMAFFRMLRSVIHESICRTALTFPRSLWVLLSLLLFLIASYR